LQTVILHDDEIPLRVAAVGFYVLMQKQGGAAE
jgi:hypothetical protein